MTKKEKGIASGARDATPSTNNLSRGALLAKLIADGGDITGRDPLGSLDLPTCLAARDIDGSFHCLQANERYLALAQRLSQLDPEWAGSTGLFQLLTDFIAAAAPQGHAAIETFRVGRRPNMAALAVCILPMRALADGTQHFLVTVSESARALAVRDIPPATRDGHAQHGVRALRVAHQKSDPYTVAHQMHTANLAFWIGAELGLKGSELTELELGATLHDIGKMAVPVTILMKPTTLTGEEMSLMRTHARMGDDIVAELHVPPMVRTIVRNHHECLDGSGYPDGLAGDAIPMPVRIISVADALEAMITPQPYRHSLSPDQALAELRRTSGRHHDGDVINAAETVMAREPLLLSIALHNHSQDAGRPE